MKPGRRSTQAPSDSARRSTAPPSSATPRLPEEPNSDGWTMSDTAGSVADRTNTCSYGRRAPSADTAGRPRPRGAGRADRPDRQAQDAPRIGDDPFTTDAPRNDETRVVTRVSMRSRRPDSNRGPLHYE